jgi:hypothetical protein
MIARVKDIKTIDSLNIVEFDFNNITLKMMSLELQGSRCIAHERFFLYF